MEKSSVKGEGATSTVYIVRNCFTNEGYLCLKILKNDLFKLTSNQTAGQKDDSDSSSSEEDFDILNDKKEIEIDFEKVKQLNNEYNMLFYLDHPNIVKAHGFYLGDKNHCPAILLEYCRYNLEERIKKNVEDAYLISFIYEIVAAMKYVHKNKIIHRDLKMKNILVNKDKHIKICDFGISKVMDLTSYTSITKGIGTLAFMAPELFNQKGTYNEKVDVYAFGVVMYFILTQGALPTFNGIGKYNELELPDSINELSQSIIKKCWSTSPDERPSFKEIKRQIIENEFKLINGIENEIQKILDHLGLE